MGIYPGRGDFLFDGDGRKIGPFLDLIPSFLNLRVADMGISWYFFAIQGATLAVTKKRQIISFPFAARHHSLDKANM